MPDVNLQLLRIAHATAVFRIKLNNIIDKYNLSKSTSPPSESQDISKLSSDLTLQAMQLDLNVLLESRPMFMHLNPPYSGTIHKDLSRGTTPSFLDNNSYDFATVFPSLSGRFKDVFHNSTGNRVIRAGHNSKHMIKEEVHLDWIRDCTEITSKLDHQHAQLFRSAVADFRKSIEQTELFTPTVYGAAPSVPKENSDESTDGFKASSVGAEVDLRVGVVEFSEAVADAYIDGLLVPPAEHLHYIRERLASV